ncbi:MAG: hypothetical protein JXR58_11025 [Bacteroidales bacterium]|nr:hypothetical protein [Bacteroidales bacterium]
MEINRHNYEEFFMDYLDGQMDEQQTACLMLFLSQNPDLEEELNSISEISMEPSQNIFPEKQKLKHFDFSQDFNKINKDELCIAYLEGDLEGLVKNKFENKLQENILLQQNLKLFEYCKIQPDYSKVFENKKALKKRKAAIIALPQLYPYIAIAASIAIIFILFPGIFSGEKNPKASKLQKIAVLNFERPVSKQNTNEIEIIQPIKNASDKYLANRVEKQNTPNNNTIEENSTFENSDLKIAYMEKKSEKLLENSKPELLIEENYSLNPVFAEDSNIPNKKTSSKRIKVWRSLETGVNTVTQFAFNKKIFNNEYNEDGSIKKLEFNTKLIAFESNFK